VKKIILLFFFFSLFFILPSSSFAALLEAPNECTWDNSKCNAKTEDCVYKGLVKYYECINPGTAFNPKHYGTCSYSATDHQACTDDDSDAICLKGPYSRLTGQNDSLRDYSLCQPKGTTSSFPISASDLSFSGKVKDLANCSIDPINGTEENYYHLAISSTDRAKGFIITTLDGKFIASLDTSSRDDTKATASFKLTAGTYSLFVRGYNENMELINTCRLNDLVVKPSKDSLKKCEIITVPNLNTEQVPDDTDVTVTVNGLIFKEKYVVNIEPGKITKEVETDQAGTLQFSFKATNNPTITIFNKNDLAQPVCDPISFSTVSNYDDEDVQYSAPAPPPCENRGENNERLSVATGLGVSFGTDAKGFVQSLFGLVLGLAGGIALILIIISGYKLILTRGNPEKMQGVKESLTAAIVGLLFIIFSVVILEIIGVDIFHIPQFGK
jgi:hypothetical protein